MNSRDQEQLDRALDRALAEYADAELRPGLEGRILARLREEPKPKSLRMGFGWLTWASALAIVAVVGLAIVFRHAAVSTSNNVAKAPVVSNSPTVQTPQTIAAQRDAIAAGRSPFGGKPHRTSVSQAPSLAAQLAPKLEQFPSAHDLSEQERLLMAYLAQTPKEEVLAAATQFSKAAPLHIDDIRVPALVVEKLSNEESR